MSEVDVHVAVRSQKVLDTLLIIKREVAFHQTEINNGATIVKRFLQVLTHVHHLVLSKVWTKFNEMLIVWLFLMLGTWSISLYPPTLAQISTLRKVPTTSTPRSRPGEQLLFCPKPNHHHSYQPGRQSLFLVSGQYLTAHVSSSHIQGQSRP